jgi:hypothetical protein
MICSHGNSSDILQNKVFYEELCSDLKIDILAYEYSGYGPEILKGKKGKKC